MIEALGADGYRVFPNVVPGDLCDRVVDDIREHSFGAENLSNIDSLEMYHYQSMWDVRQCQEVFNTFVRVLKSSELWVTIDRCCYKAPGAGHSFIHWDENPNESPRPTKVQGLVALTDTDADMGGFQCLPGLYRGLDEWLDSTPTKKAVSPGFEIYGGYARPMTREGWGRGKGGEIGWPISHVPMKRGDLLVWDSYLPHGNGVNRGAAPRLCQYVTMFQAPDDDRLAVERMRCWSLNLPPPGWGFPGDRRLIEQSRALPALLTPLGSRLLGAWPLESKP